MLQNEHNTMTGRASGAARAVSIFEMALGALMVVKTKSTVYRFLVKDPREALVEVQNGNPSFYTRPTIVEFLGAVDSRVVTSIARGQLIAGMHMALDGTSESCDQTVVTGEVEDFSIFPPQPFRLVID